jgi:hypothetical protein
MPCSGRGDRVTRVELEQCRDSDEMLAYLSRTRRSRPTPRKLLLFAAACCRRITHLNPGDWSAGAVAAAEALADGAADPLAVAAAVAAVEGAFTWAGGIITPAEEAVFAILLYPRDPGERFAVPDARQVSAAAAAGAGFAAVPAAGRGVDHREARAVLRRRQHAVVAERAVHADLLREVVGSPIRPAVFAPDWRTSAAVGLAGQAYGSRDFALLPVLGDALQDAGYADEAVLAHCRGPGPHSRGCWVVDGVLDRS